MPGSTLDIAQQIITGALAGERSSSDRHVDVAFYLIGKGKVI
jgi:hypothetical protein